MNLDVIFPRESRRRRVIASVVLLLVLAGASVRVAAQSTPFPAALERLIWKSLGPWTPLVNNPASANAVPVLDANGVPVLDIFGNPLLQSPYAIPDYTTGNLRQAVVDRFEQEFASLAPGECSYSNFGDFDEYGLHFNDYGVNGPRARLCKGPNGERQSPPLAALLDPVGLAVDDTRVYVADNFNHRVVAFDFFGNPIPLPTPIGTGVPGRGSVTDYSNVPAGHMLNAPEGLALDGARQLAVADGYNRRIAVFDSNGNFKFDYDLPNGIAERFKPSNIAITPGATLVAPGGTPADPNARFVATDWTHCQVTIMDTAFNVVRTLPEALPLSPQHDACWDPASGHVTTAGEFSTVTGVAVDAQSRIYLTDHAMNVVQVLDKDGNTLGWIGKPGIQPAPGELSGPVGVMIDHLGRVGVTDGGNARVAFYSVSYATGAPVATFEFQLDTTVSVQDFPMGLAEQIGPRPASNPNLNDPKGRFLATDPLKRRVLRFELPELAIVNASVNAGTGTFQVVVPKQKASAVVNATVSVVPVQTSGVTVDSPGPTPSAGQNIAPGSGVSYTFPYTQSVSLATFKLNAHGDFDAGSGTFLAVADEVRVSARLTCTTCVVTHQVFEDPATTPLAPATLYSGPNGNWYGHEVFVRMTPTTPNVADSNSVVQSIGWYLTGPAADAYGSGITVSSASSGFVDVRVRVEGPSSLVYWPIAQSGAEGARVTVPLPVDLRPPFLNFTSWTTPSGVDPSGRRWNNTDVIGNYTQTDIYSGAQTPTGSVTFTGEGRDLSAPVTASDYAGHTEITQSAAASNGRGVNIDRRPPVITAPANITVVRTGTNFAVLAPGIFDATASDPDLVGGAPGSGSQVASITNPGTYQFPVGTTTWTFTATDYAGNASQVQRTVTVLSSAPSSITSANVTRVYGNAVSMSASVTPTNATGNVTFSFNDGISTATAVGALDAYGNVTVTFPMLRSNNTYVNVGTYPVTISYAGTSVINPASTTATITVTPAPTTVRADAKTKAPGQPDPPLTYTADPLLNGNSYSGSLTRDPGETSGEYTIRQGTVTAGANYTITYVSAKLLITSTVIHVYADPKSKNYGDADPVLTYHLGAGEFLPSGVSFSGALARDPGELSGRYQIKQGTLSLPSTIIWFYYSDLFTINPRPANVTAGGGTKVFGTPDPGPISSSTTGFLAADNIVTTASRTAGEKAGTYSTTATIVSGNNLTSYNIGYTSGTFVITKGTVQVTAVNQTKVYGNPDPVFTFSYGPMPGGLTAADIQTAPTCTVAVAHTAAGTYPITCSGAADEDVNFTYVAGTLTVAPRPITVTADNKTKIAGQVDPPLTYTLTSGGPLLAGDSFSGALTRTAGETVGSYPITRGTLTAGPNYNMTFVNGTLTITPAPNTPPVANPDTASTTVGTPVTISVLSNDTDANGDPLTVTAVTQPAVGTGTVTFTPTGVVYTPPAGFVGTATFTYTISDGRGGSATATVTVTVSPASCSLTGFTTFTQGGWGASPNGNNPGALLKASFAQVYSSGFVRIGGTKTLTFTGASAIDAFLPAGGTANVLTTTLTNPTSSSAGVFAGQVLALQLNVDFSNAGIKKAGLANLYYQGKTVAQILALANQVLGGNTAALAPYGWTLSQLNSIVDSINRSFDGDTARSDERDYEQEREKSKEQERYDDGISVLSCKVAVVEDKDSKDDSKDKDGSKDGSKDSSKDSSKKDGSKDSSKDSSKD